MRSVRAGAPLAVAAAEADVPRATAFRWLAQGAADPTSPYSAFARELRRALAQFAMEVLRLLTGAALDARAADPQAMRAAMWLLSRRFPEYLGSGHVSSEPAATASVDEPDLRPRILVTTELDDRAAPARHPCPEELGADVATTRR